MRIDSEEGVRAKSRRALTEYVALLSLGVQTTVDYALLI